MVQGVGGVNPNNDKIIKIKDAQGNQKEIKMSIFQEGMAVTSDVSFILKGFNTTKDSKLDAAEVENLQNAIAQAAGEDNVLEDAEILKMFGIDDPNSKKAKGILKQFHTLVDRQSAPQGQPVTSTTKDEQGREVKISLNPDGSGTIVREAKDASGNVTSTTTETYGKGNVKTQSTYKDASRETVTEYTNNAEGKPVSAKSVIKDASGKVTGTAETKYTYNAQGLEENVVEQVKNNKGDLLKTTSFNSEYNDKGQRITLTTEVKQEPITDAQGNVVQGPKTSNSVTKYEYDEKGNKSKTTCNQKCGGNEVVTVTDFQDGKPVHIDTSMKKRTMKVDPNGDKVKYIKDPKTGQRIQVRYREEETTAHSVTDKTYSEDGKLATVKTQSVDDFGNPSTLEIEYEADGKTIKHKHFEGIKRGAKVVDDYTGPNIGNRSGLPTTRVEYEEDGVTVKRTTTNNFDTKGVLISRDIVDEKTGETKHYDFSECNGELDQLYYQVGRGDCYLLAAMTSLVQSEAGKSLIKENITISGTGKDKTFTVKLPGAAIGREDLEKLGIPADKIFIQDSYTVTQEELDAAALKAGSKYSAGDKDALLMELIYEKFRKDLAKTFDANPDKMNKNKAYAGLGGYPPRIQQGGDYLSGGKPAEAVYVLTGKKEDSWNNPEAKKVPTLYVDSDLDMHIMDDAAKDYQPKSDARRDEIIQNLIDDFKDGKFDHYAASADFMVSSQEVNGQTQGRSGHAFTIISITADTVTLANPWDPDNPVEMSMDDFKKSVTRIDYTPLDSEGKKIQNKQQQPEGQKGTDGNKGADGNKPVEGSSYKVPKGITYNQFIRDALKEQGLEPTEDNMRKAKEEFEAANPGKVHIYRGRRKSWRGNKYLYADDTVTIPKFSFATKSATGTDT